MRNPDLLLLHPPSVYDFRERPIAFGPISDLIPSTAAFEMYPLGFVSLLGYLRQHGFNVRIVNLAARMLRDPAFDAEAFIRRADPRAFGLDLHWLVHAHGCLEVAKIIKGEHPDTPVVVGGLSASYFHRELIEAFPQVDYVLRGDSGELPLLQLMQCIEGGRQPDGVPNLTWRDRSGRGRFNSLSHVPGSLDDFGLDYGEVVRSAIRSLDLAGHLPSGNWLEYPITAVLTCKGCLHNCVTCGGSRSAYAKTCNRLRPAFKSPERVVEEIRTIEQYVRAPVFLVGDLRQGGKRYAEEVLKGIEGEVDNPLVFELFTPASEGYLRMIAEACEPYNLEISPESHDEEIRRSQGRPYSNGALEGTLETALRVGFRKVDVFFMIGLAGQTAGSVGETVRYCARLLEKHGGDGRLHPFIAPLAPFLDPGSPAFEEPRRYGYQRLCSTLAEHREAMTAPCWKYFLSYRTRWMSRDDIVRSTYEAAQQLNTVKRRFGLIGEEEAENLAGRMALARAVTERVDGILRSTADPRKRAEELRKLKGEMEAVSRGLLCPEGELRVPYKSRIRRLGAVRALIGR